MEKVNYLGFLITREGVKPDPAKIRAIVDIEKLSNRDEVKRFLGMMSLYPKIKKKSKKNCVEVLPGTTTLFKNKQKLKYKNL